jgi:tetratricopeptide (TPR) repeat protein
MSLRSPIPRIIRIFFSCAIEDGGFLRELERQLSSLKREGLIECYNRHSRGAGVEWRAKAKTYLHAADLILLLVSPSFVESDDCYTEEAVPAMSLHTRGKTRVIPILVRPVLGWERLVFGELASLPRGKAFSMFSNKDDAFSTIVKGIQETIDELRSRLRPQSMERPLSFWNVPYWRHLFFTGREEVLADLEKTFTSPQAALQVQALSGLAGVGKTQLAVEYAYRAASNYQAILWVRADAPDILQSSFVELAEVLDLPEKSEASQPAMVKAVKTWLQENTRWLLIVDNLEDIDLLRDLVPAPHAGHILVTTRSHRTGQIAHRIDLEPMPIDEGALLLLRRAKHLLPSARLHEATESEQAMAKDIAQAVHGLPLALDQAGAYIEETGRGLSDYARLYEQHALPLLKRRGASGHDHPASVTTTFSLSLEKLKTLNPTAIELLEFCAFLHPDAIPEEMITDGAAALPALLSSAATDPLEFDRAIEDLLKFSLIQRKSDQNILIVHRLVQAVVRDGMSEERQRAYVEQVARVMNTVFPWPHFPTWAQCQRYLLQAQTVAKLIEQRNVRFAEAAQLLLRMGEYLIQRGMYHEAEGVLLQAKALEETLVDVDHPILIRILNTLPWVYHFQGRYREAEPLLQSSLERGESLLGTEHYEVATTLYLLGRNYHKQGRYREAEPLLERALALRQKVLEQAHPSIGTSMDALATLYKRQGKYEQAEALYKEALAIQQATLDQRDPSIARRLNNLAVFYSNRGKYEQAEPLAEQAVKMHEQALGETHPGVIASLDTLAVIYQEQGKYREAEPLYERIFSVVPKLLGPEHPEFVTLGNHLARLYFLQGKYSEGEETVRQALTLGEKVLGVNHHHVARSINTLADICKAQKKYSEGEELYARALTIRENVLAPNDTDTAITLESYADLLQTIGRPTEAEELRKRAEVIRNKQSGN